MLVDSDNVSMARVVELWRQGLPERPEVCSDHASSLLAARQVIKNNELIGYRVTSQLFKSFITTIAALEAMTVITSEKPDAIELRRKSIHAQAVFCDFIMKFIETNCREPRTVDLQEPMFNAIKEFLDAAAS